MYTVCAYISYITRDLTFAHSHHDLSLSVCARPSSCSLYGLYADSSRITHTHTHTPHHHHQKKKSNTPFCSCTFTAQSPVQGGGNLWSGLQLLMDFILYLYCKKGHAQVVKYKLHPGQKQHISGSLQASVRTAR